MTKLELLIATLILAQGLVAQNEEFPTLQEFQDTFSITSEDHQIREVSHLNNNSFTSESKSSKTNEKFYTKPPFQVLDISSTEKPFNPAAPEPLVVQMIPDSLLPENDSSASNINKHKQNAANNFEKEQEWDYGLNNEYLSYLQSKGIIDKDGDELFIAEEDGDDDDPKVVNYVDDDPENWDMKTLANNLKNDDQNDESSNSEELMKVLSQENSESWDSWVEKQLEAYLNHLKGGHRSHEKDAQWSSDSRETRANKSKTVEVQELKMESQNLREQEEALTKVKPSMAILPNQGRKNSVQHWKKVLRKGQNEKVIRPDYLSEMETPTKSRNREEVIIRNQKGNREDKKEKGSKKKKFKGRKYREDKSDKIKENKRLGRPNKDKAPKNSELFTNRLKSVFKGGKRKGSKGEELRNKNSRLDKTSAEVKKNDESKQVELSVNPMPQAEVTVKLEDLEHTRNLLQKWREFLRHGKTQVSPRQFPSDKKIAPTNIKKSKEEKARVNIRKIIHRSWKSF
ncbi:spliceosome-associated protein CWC27 homolog [Neocloeon triangulifer]|uniref:spliceosome-associated protein CWC27 homolog n=1 Tax=Neocloeon triangulifer TaxID=2078957 RepID=UPI00286EBB95|nr:spliceosome-associated protein CWC27 homolog [Neocloeon triangulifer]